MNWSKHFDERQKNEIVFSQVYAREFSHGTDGHNAKLIIAKMAEILNEIESVLLFDNMEENDRWDHLHRILKVSGE